MNLGIIIIVTVLAVLGYFLITHLSSNIEKSFKYHFDAFRFKIGFNGEVIPILECDFSKSNMPIIEVLIDKKKCKFLLDSGANINVLDKNIFEKIDNNKIMKTPSEGFTTASGGLESKVFRAEIKFKLEQQIFNEIFEIIDMSAPFGTIKDKDNIELHGILGTGFFQKYQWTIDFENLVVWVK